MNSGFQSDLGSDTSGRASEVYFFGSSSSPRGGQAGISAMIIRGGAGSDKYLFGRRIGHADKYDQVWEKLFAGSGSPQPRAHCILRESKMRTRRSYTLRGYCSLISDMDFLTINADDLAVATMPVRHLPTVSHSAEVGGVRLRDCAAGALRAAMCSACSV